MESGSVADWVGGTATALAVVIALFRETFLVWWNRPRFEVRVDLRPPDCHLSKMQVQTNFHPIYYLRLLVKNVGRTVARSIQVHVDQLRRCDRHGEFYVDNDFLPMNLTWAHTGAPYMALISPGTARNIDLGYVPKPNSPWLHKPRDHAEGETWFHMTLEVVTFLGLHLLTPGGYRLDLTVAAENAPALKLTVELVIDGAWHDDESKMLSDGLELRRLAYGA